MAKGHRSVQWWRILRRRAALCMLICACVAGCETVPSPILTDFSEIKAEVRVPADLFGPSFDDALTSAEPISGDHCRSLGKDAIYVSGRKEVTSHNTTTTCTEVDDERTRCNQSEYANAWEYVFLFRCDGRPLPGRHQQ